MKALGIIPFQFEPKQALFKIRAYMAWTSKVPHQNSTWMPFDGDSELSIHPYPWFPHLQNGRSYGLYHKKFKVNEPICSQKKPNMSKK